MKKVLLLLLIMTFISITVPTTFASGDDNVAEAMEILNETNATIQLKIEQAQERALNSDDDELIIEMLLHVTNKISAGGIKALEDLGFTAYCTYIEVLIDGQVVLVDPVEVYNW